MAPGFPAVVPGAGGEEDVGAGDGRGGGQEVEGWGEEFVGEGEDVGGEGGGDEVWRVRELVRAVEGGRFGEGVGGERVRDDVEGMEYRCRWS